MGRFDNVAVAGVGTTDFASIYRDRDPLRTDFGLGVEALDLALSDAGLGRGDLDGLLICRINGYERFGTMAGIRDPRVVNSYEGSGRMAGVVLQHAAALIEAGLATTVACVYGNNGRSAGMTYGGEAGGGGARLAHQPAVYDLSYGMTSPGAYVSMMYRRYADEYGVPDGALAPLALNNRRNARLNPAAVMQAELTEDDYLASRFIAEPLRLYDYCMINDGGVAIVLTTRDRARDLPKPAVGIVGSAGSGDLTAYYTKRDLFGAASRRVADEVFADAGLTRADVDAVQIYDNFTPIMLFTLEHFGFAPQGEGWEFIRKGRIERDGELPVNTSGGHTSEGYMQGWALQAEAIRQVRGDAGDRQLPHVETSQYVCVSPIITSHLFQRV